jgi:alkanesulfonate monooxygenase SsuD/methylene tetrahydromethanopterin reductase-like flavin-dependent oxidoreductase (luciferase family)
VRVRAAIVAAMLEIPAGTIAYGTQLPIQSQSSLYAAVWETSSTPADLLAIAKAADRSGYFYVAVCDHIAIPRDKAAAMGLWWQDCLTTLGWLASATERVALLSHVYVVAYRHPLVAAKGFETLDHLSGGRAIAGIGAGHVEAEFDVLDIPFSARGSLTDSHLLDFAAALENEYVGDMGSLPRPVQSPRPPIWIGGSSKPAIRRAATYDGWLPQGPATREGLDLLRSTREQAGRSGDPMAIGHVVIPYIHVGAPPTERRQPCYSGSAEQIAEAILAETPAEVNQIQIKFDADSAAHYAEPVEAFGTEVGPLLSR